MGQFISNLLTKESAKRHLIQLGITVILLGWSYVAFALLTGNWNMFSLESNPLGDAQTSVNTTGIMFMLVFGAFFGMLTYWNAKKWMLPCLKKGGLHFLGTIPFVNSMVPEEMRHSWSEEIDDLRTPTSVTTYSDGLGEKFSVNNGRSIITAVPLGIIKALFKGLGTSILNLVAAIAIPILSPLSFVFGALATQLLFDVSPEAALITAGVCLFIVLFILIVQPIIVLIKEII